MYPRLVFILFAILSTNLSAQNWVVQLVDTGGIFEDISIALTSQAYPHIVYSYYNSPRYVTKYAKWNGNAWEFQLFDSLVVIPTIKICMDSEDHSHIAFAKSNGTGFLHIIYAYNDGLSWQREIVDSFWDYGGSYPYARMLDFTLSANRIPYLSYPFVNLTDSVWEIRYAFKRRDTWIIKTIWQRPITILAGAPKISIDTAGFPVIGFSVYSSDTGWIYCAYFDGDTWNIDCVYSCRTDGIAAFAIKIDTTNRIHFLFWRFAAVFYALKENNIWNIEWLRGLSGAFVNGDMALYECRPHVVSSGSFGGFLYQYKIGPNWYWEQVPEVYFGLFPSIAIDRQGNNHVSCAGGTRHLYYARRVSTGIEDVRSQIQETKALRIYPNPAKSYFTLSIPSSASRSQIKIFDVAGKVVRVKELRSSGVDELRVSLKGINPGIYFLQLNNEPIMKKLVITK